jgi:hypothetical protein
MVNWYFQQTTESVLQTLGFDPTVPPSGKTELGVGSFSLP